jgi:hypothetical protein
MSHSSAIPSFGATNGVAGSSTYLPIDPAVETVVAVMYNYFDPSLISENTSPLITNSTNRVTLNPYGVNPYDSSNCPVTSFNEVNRPAMNLDAFLALFYPTNSGYFNVNPANTNNPAVILSKQTFTSSNSTADTFSLVQFLLRAYCTNKGLNVNDIDPRIMILLQKETYLAQSLGSIRGTTISMSWDEVINSLLRSGVVDISGNSIVSFQSTPFSVVPLAVVLNYHSFVLDIDLSIKFSYLVNISGYSIPSTPAAQPTFNAALPPTAYGN